MTPFLGCKRDVPDTRDFPYALRLESAAPESASLRPFVRGVLDQGSISSCVANAVAAGFVLAHAAQGRVVSLPSRLALYWHARAFTGDERTDGGTYLRNGIKALVRFGAPAETVWPYSTNLAVVNRRPPWRVDREGWDSHGPRSYRRILARPGTRGPVVRDAVATGSPVAFGTEVDRAFLKPVGPLVVDKPDGDIAGRHALLCVGYELGADGYRYLLLNSWGPGYRDGGFVSITDSYLEWDATDDMQILDL